jgi:hypothetical protein
VVLLRAPVWHNYPCDKIIAILQKPEQTYDDLRCILTGPSFHDFIHLWLETLLPIWKAGGTQSPHGLHTVTAHTHTHTKWSKGHVPATLDRHPSAAFINVKSRLLLYAQGSESTGSWACAHRRIRSPHLVAINHAAQKTIYIYDLFIYLFIHSFMYLFIYLFIYLYVCVYIDTLIMKTPITFFCSLHLHDARMSPKHPWRGAKSNTLCYTYSISNKYPNRSIPTTSRHEVEEN